MRVPNYTKALVLDRPVANQVDLSQISAAGATARGAAQLFDLGGQVTQKIKDTNDVTAVNSAVIRKKKDDIDYNAQTQKENEANPVGYAKRQAEATRERTQEYADTLENEDQKSSFLKQMETHNLAQHENNTQWEHRRSVEVFAAKAEEAARDLVPIAYESKSPKEFAEVLKDLDSTTAGMAASHSPEERAKFHYQESGKLINSFMAGQIERNPREAKKILADEQYAGMLDAGEKAALMGQANERIRDDAYAVLDSDNPQELITQIDRGDYNGAMDDQQKSSFKKKAVAAFEALDDKAAAERSMAFATTNTETYNKHINGELTFADLTELERRGADSEAITSMRKSLLKRNPVSIDKQQEAIVELAQGYSDLKIEKKKGKIKYSGSLESLVRFQNKVMAAEANGEINKSTAGSFMNKILTPWLEKINAEEGFDDKGFFFDGDEPYDVAFQSIQDHLERTGQEGNTPLKAKMLTMAIEEADRMDIEKVTDPEAREGMLKSLAKRVLVKYGEAENPVNRLLPDSPNANLKRDGTVSRNGNFETKLPADAKAAQDFTIKTGGDGRKYRVFSNGKFEVIK